MNYRGSIAVRWKRVFEESVIMDGKPGTLLVPSGGGDEITGAPRQLKSIYHQLEGKWGYSLV